MPKIIKKCLRCGKEFGVWPSNAARYPYDYCSRACTFPPLIRICDGCGKEFKSVASRKQEKYFCNTACRTSPESHARQFWAQVNMEGNGCWPWMGQVNEKGYGHINYDGVHTFAHRIAFRLSNEEFDDSLDTLHSCDNPPCCRPDHLFQGTNSDNVKDKVDKNRQARKLEIEQVQEIRRLYKEGKLQIEIAGMFGIRDSQVSRIVNGTRWGHLPISTAND